MFTIYLKNGKTVQVLEDDLEEFLEKNREQIQVQSRKMGERRAVPVSTQQLTSSK